MKRFAILLPWFSFFLREKYVTGYICLALQISIIGWPIASAWALITLLKNKDKSQNNAILQTLQPSYYERDNSVKSIA